YKFTMMQVVLHQFPGAQVERQRSVRRFVACNCGERSPLRKIAGALALHVRHHGAEQLAQAARAGVIERDRARGALGNGSVRCRWRASPAEVGHDLGAHKRNTRERRAAPASEPASKARAAAERQSAHTSSLVDGEGARCDMRLKPHCARRACRARR
ncbi:MAG: hypothetical protein RL385_4398, partial [Pseudomonadota bacterium]